MKITRCATAVVEANYDYTGIPGLAFYDLNNDHTDVVFVLLLDCVGGISCELGYAGQGRRD
jgi:hypothetical protein